MMHVISRGLSGLLLGACIGFLVLAPFFHFWPFLSWHDHQRLLAGLLLLLSWPAMVIVDWPRGRSRILLLGMLLLACFSVAYAEQSYWAQLEAAWFVLLLGLGWSLANSANVERLSYWLALALGCAVAAHTALTLVDYLLVLRSGKGVQVSRLFSGFDNIRFFAQWQAFIVPALVALPGLVRRKYPWVAGLLWGVLVLQCAFFIAHASRGVWLGLAVATVLLVVHGGEAGRAWGRRMVLATLCGGLVYGLLFHALPSPPLPGEASQFALEIHRNYTTLSGREVLWAQALAMIQAHPWLGIGPMGFSIVIGPYGSHPHNAYLQLAAEWGLPFALSVFALIFLGVRHALCRVRGLSADVSDLNQSLAPAVLAGLLTALVLAAVDGVIVMPVAQVLLALWAGWLAASLKGGGLQSLVPAEHRSLLDNCMRLAMFMLLGAAAFVVVQELSAGPRAVAIRERVFVQEERPTEFKPRFWRQGWIGATPGRQSARADGEVHRTDKDR